ncbi:phage tail protein [Salmonella enterica subsp. enterica serovar Amager]|nr:phage tail protein [Salmonella enterica subsp. enterica serovar Amager]EBV5219464.1 phage tail protein [Salmonella enterica subsp. enterica serovar Amager]
MSTKYFALLTNIGAAKLAKATALGMQVEITQMAVGDGNDTLPTPDPAQTALAREIRRAPLNVLTVDPLNTSQIIAEQVIPEDVGGWWIREIGLFDKDGDMVAIANCAETYKPQLQEGSGRVQVIRVILIVSSTQAVTLKIDPAVVLATRQYVDSEIIEVKSYVDDKLTEHAQSRNHPDATLTDKGFVQLSSATGSTDETKAATPKAVKAAMDNANKRQPGNENLTALSSLAGQPDKLPYFTNKGAMSLSDFAAFMRTMLSKTDAASVLEYLGLKETLNPTKRVSIGNIGNGAFDGSNPCINIGDSDSGFIGSADGVLDIYCNNVKVGYIDGTGLHMLTDIYSGDARLTLNGDIFGSVWGDNWLSIWITNQLNRINNELATRDNNINTRATWDYVNQTFARKNAASLQDWGWIIDDSTGFIMQWGTIGSSNGTYNFPRAFPASCFAVFVTNTSAQGSAVDNAFGYPVSNSQFFAATKRSDTNALGPYPVAWFAIGR